ncbi:MAG: hypothetical protein AB7N69_09665 [Immundisolibacter sp.]|uniref:hypothetical protein n=1 Tax=Immundisolibacter sp. TaxID=1934948 RepID=UPI003D133F61
MYVNTQRLQRGLSLVEVFVALLVLSVGLIALAKLQVDLVRGSSDARTRTVALALAEEKVEDLRTFAVTTGGGSWSTTASPMAWSYVSGPALATPADTGCSPACTGGRLPPQATYSSALEVAGVRFKRTWEVANRNFTGTGAITSRTKDARVTVAWLNELGVEQQVSVFANLVDIPPGNVALASRPVAERPEGPQIAYTPGLAPEVIGVPIDTGTGKRETTKPIPTVKKTAESTTVTFDVVNYNADTNTVSRREEFVTINCKCTFSGTGRGRTPAKVALVGNQLRDVPGQVFTDKVVGVSADSLQPKLCDVCCRDHHDYSADGVDYFYKPADSVAHQHYRITDLSTPVTSGNYDEACRLKRVNGVFQVFEDWQLRTLTVLPKTDLLEGAPKQAEYINAVKAYVLAYGDAVADGTTPPAALTFTPSTVNVGTSQLLSRAIYIDDMPASLVSKVGTLLNDADSTNDALALSLIPFYELHLTKLAEWISGDSTRVQVSSAYVVDADDGVAGGGVYSRGFVQAKAGAASGTPTIISTAKRYNTGLTATSPINPTEDSLHPITSTVIVGSGPSATPYYYTSTPPEVSPAPTEHRDGSTPVTIVGDITISGTFIKAAVGATLNINKINPATRTAGTCTEVAVSSGVEGYSCTVPSGWTGTITFSSSNPKDYSFCLSDTPACSTTTKLPGTSSSGNWVITSPVTTSIVQPIYVYDP